MVLKVVRDKILKTWKLWCGFAVRGSILGTASETGPEARALASEIIGWAAASEAAPAVRLSKI
jgi:hypothetical protein